ncbi:hypothetical protein K466DRAFT_606266 [Polyporus arcularius HHB13444]|uniref:Uncharacterized protein n=1 Tax=Polyporus arcularius HHB13444 TaxID=1314778 RepID=A0A5C3NSA9_9APHY|nr:hypothetical protein K466DRAFT_606266 [Polyporus arcularius HHB13444]
MSLHHLRRLPFVGLLATFLVSFNPAGFLTSPTYATTPFVILEGVVGRVLEHAPTFCPMATSSVAAERTFQAAASLRRDPIRVVADTWSSPRGVCFYMRTAIIPGWGSVLLSVAEMEGVDDDDDDLPALVPLD